MTNIQIEHNLKFTTANLGCFLRLPLNQKNLALANILTNMQANATQKYAGVGLQARALEELYDLNLEIFPEVFGNQIIIFYLASFVEPREVLDPDYSYSRIIETFFNIVKKPLFNPQLLQITKAQLQTELKQFYDLPANYALKGFFENWYRKTPEFKDNIFGDPEVIQNCTVEQINNFFHKLTTYPAICLGQAQDPDLVTDLIQPQLTWPGFSMDFAVKYLALPAHYAPLEKVESKNVEQAQLLLGYGYDYQLPINLRQFGGLILSQYLSGDESSKLFINVREKLGAAYAIDTVNYLNNSLFLINTGLDQAKITAAKSEIEKAIQALAKGQVDFELFKKAKQAIKRTYITSGDRQDLIMIQMLANALRNRQLTFADRIAEVDKFSSNQLIKFAQNLFLNESYILK